MKPVIYQLVVRYFGNTNTTNRRDGTVSENGCGKFSDINTAALQSLAEFGITHIWLTGVLRQATLTDYSAIGLPADDPDVVKGRAGSFYAVRDYYDVCPDYAEDTLQRMAEFEALLQRIHDAGLKVLIDLVPNHVARGYASIVKPERDFGLKDDQTQFFARDNHFFYLPNPPGQRLRLTKPDYWNPSGVQFDGEFQREDGAPGRVPKATGNNGNQPNPSSTDWYETVKLNYGYNFATFTGHYDPCPRTWDSMDEIVAYWQAKGVDGFRCDFAHYVPAEFWSFLIRRSRQRDPQAFFIAEAYPNPAYRDPISEMRELVEAGFDAVYHDNSYDTLKRIYEAGKNTQDDYDREMISPPVQRLHLVEYLENHDEVRIGAPIEPTKGEGESGLGSPAAGYQLAPLQFLYGNGPVLMLNGQEIGEHTGGGEGFNNVNGRSTFFDYWGMPEFVKWVNGHTYDGGGLSAEQKALRRFYSALNRLCQDPAVLGDGYWGLKYYNRRSRFEDCPDDLYSFARYQPDAGRLLLIVANFRPQLSTTGRLRIPAELVAAAALPGQVRVRMILDESGAKNGIPTQLSSTALAQDGFSVTLPTQVAHVYEIA